MIDAVAARRESQPEIGRSPIHWAAGLMLAEAATFLVAASLHRGVQIPLGFITLAEPMIRQASLVETTCGLALAVAAVTVLVGSRWGWLATVGAHLLSAGGVVLGIVALNAGRGPRTASNDAHHLAILAALLIGLALLLTPPVRAALRRRHTR